MKPTDEQYAVADELLRLITDGLLYQHESWQEAREALAAVIANSRQADALEVAWREWDEARKAYRQYHHGTLGTAAAWERANTRLRNAEQAARKLLGDTDG